MTRVFQLFISSLAILALGGCIVSRHPAGIASSTAPIAPGYSKIGLAERDSCSYWVFFIPVSSMDRADEIIDELVKEKGALALVGVTVEHTRHTFVLPLFGSECTSVRGQVVKGASK
jgi:hypothetical protein